MKRILSVSGMFLILASCVSVEGQEQSQQDRRLEQLETALRRNDANKDGKISKEEFRGPEQAFERLDRNGDGFISREDLQPQRNANRGRGMGRIPDDVEVKRDLVYGKGGGRDLTMHLVLPKEKRDEPSPMYVWIHGGGWAAGTKDGGVSKAIQLVRLGFIGATIEYRLTGEAPFPAQIEDCKCAIRYFKAHAEEYGIDPDRIVVAGSSAGGHLAALVGTSGDVKELEGNGGWQDQSSRVHAVIDLYGPTDLMQFVVTEGYERHNDEGSPESKLLGGGIVTDSEEKVRQINPITYIDKDDPPFLIFHGDSDRTVPLNQSQLLDKALKEAGVASELHVLEGAGHGGPQFASPEVNELQRKFLLKLLEKN